MTTNAPEPLSPRGRPDPRAADAYLAELYERHGRTVLGLCRILLRDPTEAEDAAQQTFLSALRSLRSGRPPRHPAAWLATIARNECWNRIQRRMRQPLAEHPQEGLGELPDPLESAVRKADLAALWAAIAQLPTQQREALLMREFSGLSYEELAEALAVSQPAVESLLVRARRELRLRLRPVAAASVAPLLAVREAVARLASLGDPPAAVGKLASLPLAAKLVAGAAAVGVVAGGTTVAVDPSLLAGGLRGGRPPIAAGDSLGRVAREGRPASLGRPVAAVSGKVERHASRGRGPGLGGGGGDDHRGGVGLVRRDDRGGRDRAGHRRGDDRAGSGQSGDDRAHGERPSAAASSGGSGEQRNEAPTTSGPFLPGSGSSGAPRRGGGDGRHAGPSSTSEPGDGSRSDDGERTIAERDSSATSGSWGDSGSGSDDSSNHDEGGSSGSGGGEDSSAGGSSGSSDSVSSSESDRFDSGSERRDDEIDD